MRLGLDIGGTKTDAVAIDDEGTLIGRTRLATGLGAEAVIETAVTAVTRLEQMTGPWGRGPRSIGVGVPGVVDTFTGRVRHAVNLGFNDCALGGRIGERLNAPVYVENDVNAAALGAYHLMGLRGSVGYLNLGTGLAAGIVVDGKLWRGARGAAGELGHIPVDPEGAICSCGQRGCLETIASGSAVARQWPSLPGPHPPQVLFTRASEGDVQAQASVTKLAAGVAAAVRMLVLTFDTETVVVGGGLSLLGENLLRPVRETMDSWRSQSPFLASLDLASRVKFLPDGPPVAAYGAATINPPVNSPKS